MEKEKNDKGEEDRDLNAKRLVVEKEGGGDGWEGGKVEDELVSTARNAGT